MDASESASAFVPQNTGRLYAIDTETYQILHSNVPGENLLGQRCYEALLNQGEPCSFCPIGKFEGIHKWEHYHEPTGRYYKVTNKEENGVLFSHSADITPRPKPQKTATQAGFAAGRPDSATQTTQTGGAAGRAMPPELTASYAQSADPAGCLSLISSLSEMQADDLKSPTTVFDAALPMLKDHFGAAGARFSFYSPDTPDITYGEASGDRIFYSFEAMRKFYGQLDIFGADPRKIANLDRFIGVLRIYIDRAVLYKKVKRAARRDRLTDCYNRDRFISYALRRNVENVGLLITDIQNLRKINENFGLTAGDEAICHIANLLREASANPAPELYRISGDQFAAVFHKIPKQKLDSYVIRLLRILKQPFGEVTPNITYATAYSKDRTKVADLYAPADAELNRRKRSIQLGLLKNQGFENSVDKNI